MNKSISCRLAVGARIIAALCAGFFWMPVLRAQPTEETVDSRVLLVFDTSADMKRRLPEVQSVLKDFFLFEGSGQLREGDTIGVNTFGPDVKGELPLQPWATDEVGTIVTNIVRYISKVTYAKTTRFDKLLPWINKLAQNSERLTVLIFCDGEGEFQGTPFDAGINQVFQQRSREAQKAKMPFVIVLRSQLGQYVGCTVNFPKATFNLPTFPPLPLPPPPPPPKKIPPPAPRPVAPPLIIVGTTVGTNLPPPKPKVEITNAPPPITNIVTTNIVFIPNHSGLSSGGALGIALGLLAAAVVLGIVAWRRARHSDSSLITRSMNQD